MPEIIVSEELQQKADMQCALAHIYRAHDLLQHTLGTENARQLLFAYMSELSNSDCHLH